MKNLSESLLDSFDDIAQGSDIMMYLQGCYQKWENATGPGRDALGRPLKVGDLGLVIWLPVYQHMSLSQHS